jgi:ATP/maltotriose-dependent transcriptional regulator MalT
MFKPMSASHDWVPPGIVRQRPLQLLTHALHYPVTLLLAPAGAGKSVLLQQWLVSEGIAPVFLQVQNRDNDFGSFMRRLTSDMTLSAFGDNGVFFKHQRYEDK